MHGQLGNIGFKHIDQAQEIPRNMSTNPNRIEALFHSKGQDILNIYFTAGYPTLEDFPIILEALQEAGVDLIEIGMPYSDPLADGPTIQESGTMALKNGMTLELLFSQIEAIRPNLHTPLILMGYYNQVMQYGEQAFVDSCRKAGIDGLILPDLPLREYETGFQSLVEEAGLSISFLITPQTSAERIRQIDALSRGFIYMVSSASITGAKTGITDTQMAYFERIAAMNLEHPRLIGFGISDRATYQTACAHAQGAIIGSAFIKALGGEGNVREKTLDFIRGIR